MQVKANMSISGNNQF